MFGTVMLVLIFTFFLSLYIIYNISMETYWYYKKRPPPYCRIFHIEVETCRCHICSSRFCDQKLNFHLPTFHFYCRKRRQEISKAVSK